MNPKPWHRIDLRAMTPAFLGRFQAEDGASIQIPFPVASLRGTLAFWFRAIAGPYTGNNIAELLRAETMLFGGPSDERTARPSPIWLKAARITVTVPRDPSADLAYLMGPGLTDDKQPSPRCWRPSVVRVEVRNTGKPECMDLFLGSLWALRAFGGLGARSRRGFGTLAVNHLDAKLPASVANFDRSWLIRDRLADFDAILECTATALTALGIRQAEGWRNSPTYPCFADGYYHHDEHQLAPPGTQPDDALALSGRLLRDFRHPKEPGWSPPEDKPYVRPNTEGYRTVARVYANQEQPTAPFRDGALGLPVVYTVEGLDDKVTVEPIVNDAPSRRASPLWLRVTNIGTAGWRLRSLAFYSEWLPNYVGLRVRTKGRDDAKSVEKPSQVDVRNRLVEWFDYLPLQRIDGS